MSERFRWVWLLMTVVMGIGVLAGGGVLYTNAVQREAREERIQLEREAREETIRVEREAQQDLCELLAVFDDPMAPPPTTARGRAQVEAMRAYRAKRC